MKEIMKEMTLNLIESESYIEEMKWNRQHQMKMSIEIRENEIMKQ